jgi:hypothetical protein
MQLRRAGHALTATALLLVAPAAASAELPIDGITVGRSVGEVARILGPPARVTSADSGNEFVFAHGTTAYTDDDGIVLAVGTQTGSPRIEIEGAVRAFGIGTYSAARADAELADIAEFTTETARSYRIAPRRDLVFAFDRTQRLERVTYGEPGQLVRLGLLPGDAAAKAVTYHAPRLRGSASVSADGSGATVYRIAIDRAGAVKAVDVVIASALTGDDASVARHLRTDHYAPATLDGRPIAAAIFVEAHP